MKRERCPFCQAVSFESLAQLAQHVGEHCPRKLGLPAARKGFYGWFGYCFCWQEFGLGNGDQPDWSRVAPHWEAEGGLTAHLLYILMTKGELK
jgi:hypothetical protein